MYALFIFVPSQPWPQVRFELTFFALNPELKVVAPWREWEITGREDAVEYAKKHNIPIPVTKKSIYSRDRNLWHLSHEVSLPLHLFLWCYQIKMELFTIVAKNYSSWLIFFTCFGWLAWVVILSISIYMV